MKDYLNGVKKLIEEHPWLVVVTFVVLVIACVLFLRWSRWGQMNTLPTGNGVPAVTSNSEIMPAERAAVDEEVAGEVARGIGLLDRAAGSEEATTMALGLKIRELGGSRGDG